MAGRLLLLALAAKPALARPPCSEAGDNCWHSKCCADSKLGCYAKKEGYALCLSECEKGMHLTDPPKDQYWECNQLFPCAWGSKSGENCMITGCCNEPFKTCFAREDGYGQCKHACPKGWNCTKVTDAHPYLAEPCNKLYKQCGGTGFKGNPCCEEGLVCTGKHPKYYMQCRKKWEVEKEKKEQEEEEELDDEDIGLAAASSGVARAPPRALTSVALGLTTVAVASALVSTALVLRRKYALRPCKCNKENDGGMADAEELLGIEG